MATSTRVILQRMAGRRKRVFSGIQPSGVSHIGNYLGAIRNWVSQQETYDNIFCIVNLHALTLPTEPDSLHANTITMANTLLAAVSTQTTRSCSFRAMYVNTRSFAGC
ncbi:MAG: hypothetical protein R2848_09225 [Thermomicrobiales bacterium]